MDASVRSSSGKTVTLQCAKRELPDSERRKAALKTLGLFWGLALASAPLPPVHWVLTPGFFLFGIYAAVKRYRVREHLNPLTFSCPECSGKVEVSERAFQSELSLTCPHCRYLLRMQCGVVG